MLGQSMLRVGSYPFRCLALGAGSLALALLLALTPVARNIDLSLGDALLSLSAPAAKFDDAVVVDVDEPSMARLESQIGAWPYDRDVYALVNRYLLDAGAAMVAYDILFSEARGGDDAFAATLTPKNVLAAAALPYGGAAHDRDYRKRLAAAAWARGDDWPAQPWDDLTLPLAKFSAQAHIGVISVKPDADGVLRRVPLLHRVYGEVLPALAPLALKVGGLPVKIDPAGRTTMIGGAVAPTDEAGMVRLRFPRNWHGVRIVPFYEVALAASGAPEYAALAQTLRGKHIYVGSSSAVLGDFIQTPVGRVAGLYLLSVLPSMLKNGMVLQPRQWLLDGALTLLILLLALAVAHPRLQEMVWVQALALPGLLLLTAVAVTGLSLLGRSAAVLLPAACGVLAHLGAVTWRQIHLFQKSRQLLVEKLAAEESARLKSQFLSHMTHELRTPLTAIVGFNNINWHSDDLGRDQRLKNSEIIDRNGRHLLALINGILDQAKLEAGQVRIVTQPENMRVVVGDVVATLQALVRDKPVTLAASYAPGLPEALEIDAFRVRQILLNLTGNAIKFTERGSVNLNVSWSQGMLSIEVADTGPGLSKEGLARLFVAFQQADDTVAATHGGTGLGLTISRDLAALMQGEIGVASELGAGTRFTLRLPAASGYLTDAVSGGQPPAGLERSATAGAGNGPATDAAVSSAAAPQPRPAATKDAVPGAPPAALRSSGPDLSDALYGTVLLVEDSADVRALMLIYLKRLGVTVVEAVNGQEAVEFALRDAPDAILMDMEMPVLNGVDAVKALRAQGFGRPILALTGHSGEAEHARALAAGCNDVLTKPVSRTVLRAALDGALSARRPGV